MSSRSQKRVAVLTSNYRTIALTCVLSKIFKTLLNSHFLDHLESHSLISDHQYGFRRSRSTGDILSYLTDLWSSALRDYGESCVVALDISKAFDRVWHASLLSNLPSFGFPPSLCLLLSSFLSGRSISAVVDGASSSSFPINCGVPQGSVLSPTLFLLFINDILSCSSNSIHSMPMTRLSTLLLILNPLLLSPLDLILVFYFPTLFLPIWRRSPGGAAAIL